MDAKNESQQPQLFTVGHSNHPLPEFIDLLRKHAIQVLADTRSYPYSKYVSQYNREELQAELQQAGIKYLYLGNELGGRPEGEDFYDEQGYVLYSRVAESARFLKGIERLETGIRRYRVAIMCSEENPEVCHRHLLVGRVMDQRGASVTHIRGNGELQAYSSAPPACVQGMLFDLPEVNPWKSLRSVLRKKQPSSSSESSDAMGSSDSWMSD